MSTRSRTVAWLLGAVAAVGLFMVALSFLSFSGKDTTSLEPPEPQTATETPNGPPRQPNTLPEPAMTPPPSMEPTVWILEAGDRCQQAARIYIDAQNRYATDAASGSIAAAMVLQELVQSLDQLPAPPEGAASDLFDAVQAYAEAEMQLAMVLNGEAALDEQSALDDVASASERLRTVATSADSPHCAALSAAM